MHKDPYDVLGVPRDAPFHEVRAQYFRLARRHHPDKLGAVSEEERCRNENIFKEITNAYDTIENAHKHGEGSPTTMRGEVDWRTVWARVEGLFQRPDVWDCMRRVLKDTVEDVVAQVAEKRRKERLVHTIHMPITLEELHQGKKKKLQLFLNQVKQPVRIVVDCHSYPRATFEEMIDSEIHTIHIHMDLKEHALYRFDELIPGRWDLYATVHVSWLDFMQGKALTLPDMAGGDICIDIPVMPRMDVPIVMPNQGVAGRGDLYVILEWALPTPQQWAKIREDDKKNFVNILNALTA